MRNDLWTDLQETWKQTPAADLSAMVARAHRARRLAGLWRTTIAGLSLALLVAAVAHAATPSEAIVALGIGVTIGAAWMGALLAERRQRELLGEAGDRYVNARVEQLRREVNVLRFVWVIVALELLFLLPWWIEGIPIHFGSLASIAALFTLWLPLAGIGALLAWTVRRWHRSRRELTALASHSGTGSSL